MNKEELQNQLNNWSFANTATSNRELFENSYFYYLTKLMLDDPDYEYVREQNKDLDQVMFLTKRMTQGLITGSASNSGKAIQKACKALGINPTYKAIREYLA